jgi:hypothetical protein
MADKPSRRESERLQKIPPGTSLARSPQVQASSSQAPAEGATSPGFKEALFNEDDEQETAEEVAEQSAAEGDRETAEEVEGEVQSDVSTEDGERAAELPPAPQAPPRPRAPSVMEQFMMQQAMQMQQMTVEHNRHAKLHAEGMAAMAQQQALQAQQTAQLQLDREERQAKQHALLMQQTAQLQLEREERQAVQHAEALAQQQESMAALVLAAGTRQGSGKSQVKPPEKWAGMGGSIMEASMWLAQAEHFIEGMQDKAPADQVHEFIGLQSKEVLMWAKGQEWTTLGEAIAGWKAHHNVAEVSQEAYDFLLSASFTKQHKTVHSVENLINTTVACITTAVVPQELLINRLVAGVPKHVRPHLLSYIIGEKSRGITVPYKQAVSYARNYESSSSVIQPDSLNLAWEEAADAEELFAIPQARAPPPAAGGRIPGRAPGGADRVPAYGGRGPPGPARAPPAYGGRARLDDKGGPCMVCLVATNEAQFHTRANCPRALCSICQQAGHAQWDCKAAEAARAALAAKNAGRDGRSVPPVPVRLALASQWVPARARVHCRPLLHRVMHGESLVRPATTPTVPLVIPESILVGQGLPRPPPVHQAVHSPTLECSPAPLLPHTPPALPIAPPAQLHLPQLAACPP